LATDMLASQPRAQQTQICWPSFQQNFESKQWVNGLGSRARQRWPRFLKHALIVTSPPENPKSKVKNFFWSQLEDLLNL